MPFSVCYYHVIWTTKNRAALLTPAVEKIVLASIQQTSKAIRSPIEALNGCENHIHVAVRIALSLSVSQWVKRIKGTSSFAVNKAYPDGDKFRWQGSYGVLTFGAKQLPFVTDYILRQKEHHRANALQPYLEETGSDDDEQSVDADE